MQHHPFDQELHVTENKSLDIGIHLPDGRTIRVALRAGLRGGHECADISLEVSPDTNPDATCVPHVSHGRADIPVHKAIVFGCGTTEYHSGEKSNAAFSTILLDSNYYPKEAKS